eukprot:1175071-Pyramimonas_sp.AAC.1
MPVAAESVPCPILSQEVLDASADVKDFLQSPLFAKCQQLLKESAPPTTTQDAATPAEADDQPAGQEEENATMYDGLSADE